MYGVIQDDLISLLGLKLELEEFDCNISKTALHKRFTKEAVAFTKRLLADQISKRLEVNTDLNNKFFKQICIKDSTKFRLPDSMENDFPGYGFKNLEKQPKSMINIQYEYDLLSGNWLTLDFTKVNRNDQCDSKETIDKITKDTLYIRDLGYVTLPYLQAVEAAQSYYLNRLPHHTAVFIEKEGHLTKIDWISLHKEMGKTSQIQQEIQVCLGNLNMLKTRMVIFRENDAVYEKRVRKLSNKRKGKNGFEVTDEYKARAHYSIFITNVPQVNLSAIQIRNIYKCRWQIEIIFKAWKSHVKIGSFRNMGKERFECQLMAKFIWILLYWKVFQTTNSILKLLDKNASCSILKFYIRAKKLSSVFRKLSSQKLGIYDWLKTNIISFAYSVKVEVKKGKLNKNQIIMSL